MPIRFTGHSAPNPNTGGTDYQAADPDTGVVISVEASLDAVRDHGEQAIARKATEKYDLGQVANNTVSIHTTDFR